MSTRTFVDLDGLAALCSDPDPGKAAAAAQALTQVVAELGQWREWLGNEDPVQAARSILLSQESANQRADRMAALLDSIVETLVMFRGSNNPDAVNVLHTSLARTIRETLRPADSAQANT